MGNGKWKKAWKNKRLSAFQMRAVTFLEKT